MAIEFRNCQINEPPGHIPMAPLHVKFVLKMVPWCNNNLIDYWCWQENFKGNCIFWFESEEDMVKFILKWE